MNQITKGDFTTEITREIEDLRSAAAEAQNGLRTLRDLEMAWVAGGSDQPLWV
ncbi:MAG TPA: hypothetical protein VFP36_03765 [Usitatibacter sp.]|nr:hypothetical protein [Usitatibacter sp.]